MSLDDRVGKITAADSGRRVEYRFLGKGPVLLTGVLQRQANSWKYGEGVKVVWDDRQKPQFAYIRDLCWTDLPPMDVSWGAIFNTTMQRLENNYEHP